MLRTARLYEVLELQPRCIISRAPCIFQGLSIANQPMMPGG